MSYRLAGHDVTPGLVVAALALLVAAITLSSVTGASGWFVALGLIGPDLAFLLAIGQQMPAPGRMPARVIPVYNAVHRFAGPLVLGAVSIAFLVLSPNAPVVAAAIGVTAISWLCHVVWDRSVGYGLRDRDGAIMPVRALRNVS